MEHLAGMIAFALSVGSAVVSGYLFLVKSQQERPQLRVFKAEPKIGGYAVSSSTDPVKLVFEVKAIVANYSSLPNALLGLRAWVKTREGTWREAEAVADPKTPLPLNLAPLQTVRLNLTATVAFPAVPSGEACRNTNETFVLYRDHYIAQPVEVKVELGALGDKPFTEVLTSVKPAT
jgi:hypothetical protein